MDVLFIVVMFVVVSIIDNLSKRKRPRVPPPQNREERPNFDIPTLANDPNLPSEEIPILIETPRPDKSAAAFGSANVHATATFAKNFCATCS